MAADPLFYSRWMFVIFMMSERIFWWSLVLPPAEATCYAYFGELMVRPLPMGPMLVYP